ncbi:hypothetical protein GCM10010121_091230 [Streptomyces brasiliensis]|uniref:DUF742 domain-containing protein n=1 Tax=Streptomyces brasiliensis TaxID=1954 RepID=A0A917ULN8_9ACTN|nr:hypothetical protein GCM10010121_091230 [Streptomyces brasiliensis]
MCREIKSVAEISALLRMPLGVARILVADMAEAGLVVIHQPDGAGATGGRLDTGLLERAGSADSNRRRQRPGPGEALSGTGWPGRSGSLNASTV